MLPSSVCSVLSLILICKSVQPPLDCFILFVYFGGVVVVVLALPAMRLFATVNNTKVVAALVLPGVIYHEF